jgi:hypothetical protein
VIVSSPTKVWFRFKQILERIADEPSEGLTPETTILEEVEPLSVRARFPEYRNPTGAEGFGQLSVAVGKL